MSGVWSLDEGGLDEDLFAQGKGSDPGCDARGTVRDGVGGLHPRRQVWGAGHHRAERRDLSPPGL